MSEPFKVWVITMSGSNNFHAAYILHSRKYRDTSLLIELFSRDEGRYTLVARGARGKKSKFNLQLFSPVMVSSFGRGELKTASAIESNGLGYQLSGKNLFIGLYINELLFHVLGKFDPFPNIFDRYGDLLAKLQSDAFATSNLRLFELSLLADLGYGISFDVESLTGDPIMPDKYYFYFIEDGFHYALEGKRNLRPIEGKHILAIAQGKIDIKGDKILRDIVRQSVDHLLGGKPLNSRKLFA